MCDLQEPSIITMGQWSNLPLELLEVIECKLTLYLDKLRIRMVCKSWRSFLPNLHERPLLLHSFYNKTEGMHRLFNPIDNKIYEIDLKGANGSDVRGCCYGWAAIFSNHGSPYDISGRQVYLINMFTNARVNLPPTRGSHHDLQQQLIRKIVLSSPFADENCTAVAIYKYSTTISYCKCGDKTWTYLYSAYNVQDVIFHEGKLLVLSWDGDLSVYEEIGQSAKPTFVIEIFKRNWIPWAYLVKPSTGGIIVVYIIGNIYASLPTRGFELYKIDLINAKRVRIYDIGNANMFLDRTSAMMVSSTGDEGNQIYIIETVTKWELKNEKASLSVFDLKKGTFRDFSDLKISSQVFCPHSIWVKMNGLKF